MVVSETTLNGAGAPPCEVVPPRDPCNEVVRRCGRPRRQATKRILISSLRANGDLLMASPLLAALRASLPDAHLTWLVERKFAAAVDADPHVDEIVLWDWAAWNGITTTNWRRFWHSRPWDMRHRLGGRRYDVLISLFPEVWSTIVRGVAAPLSIAVFDTFRQTEGAPTGGRDRFYDVVYAAADLPPHRTDQYLLPLRALCLPEPSDKRMRLGFTAEDDAAAARFLSAGGVGASERFVVMAPMTTWATRCWPIERYAALADTLARRHGCRTVLIGSAKEEESVEQVAAGMQTTPVLAAGALTFRELAALVARAALLVSGDTGPMHVAGAVGTPYLALFGPTPAQGRVPLAGRGAVLAHSVPCGPCDLEVCPNLGEDYIRCMTMITVAEAVEAAGMLLDTDAVTK